MMKKRMIKRGALALMLCSALSGVLPVQAFADESNITENQTESSLSDGQSDISSAALSDVTAEQPVNLMQDTEAGGDSSSGADSSKEERSGAEENQNDKEDEKRKKGAPSIRIRRKKVNRVRSRSSFKVTLLLDNSKQSYPLTNVELTLDTGDGLALQEDSATIDVGTIEAGKIKEVTIHLKAEKSITASAMNLNVSMYYEYENSAGAQDGTKKARIMLQSSPTGKEKEEEDKERKGPMPFVRISQNGAPDALGPDTDFEIDLTVDNTKQAEPLTNVELSIEPGSELVLREPGSTIFLDQIDGRGMKQCRIRLRTGKKLTTSSQTAAVTLRYTYKTGKADEQGVKEEKLFFPTIPTEDKDEKELAIPTPNIIVSKYSYGEQVAAGKEFNLHLEIKNTSSNTTAENMLMSLETGEALAITDSSNTFYIEKLNPQESLTKEVTVKALANGKPEHSKIDISFKYEFISQKARAQATSTEKLAIPLVQPDRFIVNPAQILEAIHKDSEATISFPYVNKGKSAIYNVEAKLAGGVDAVEAYKYLGNFESGSSGTIDFLVTPHETGNIPIKVTITYEDSSNTQQTMEFPMDLSIQDAADMNEQDEFGFEDEYGEEKKTVNKKMIFLLFSGFFLFFASIVLFVKVKKRKKVLHEQELLKQLESEDASFKEEAGDFKAHDSKADGD